MNHGEDHPTLLNSQQHIVYKLVLTGGPCGGKTTGQARLSTFFENLGWKVYRVPETATLLMSGGIKWTELSSEQAQQFQESLLKTMMQVEQTYFDLAELSSRNTLVICDRGVMDPSAYMETEGWTKLTKKYDWNNVDLRDSRYNQVIHMATAAKGAEEFYTTEEHVVRHEGPELARELDDKVAQAWVGHPYYDVIDNSSDFEGKLVRMIGTVCNRIGLDFSDRLSLNSKKRKFLVLDFVPDDSKWPSFEEFDVVHDYLVTPHSKMQARIRKRGQNGCSSYQHTVRKGPRLEQKATLRKRAYEMLLAQRDDSHYTIYKKRRCFLWNNKYYQLDIYQEPCHPRCIGLMILETYTSLDGALNLPDFLKVESEVTDELLYSMYNLSLKEYHTHELQAGAKSPNGKTTFNYREAYAQQISTESANGNLS